jgi:hypothetical protein
VKDLITWINHRIQSNEEGREILADLLLALSRVRDVVSQEEENHRAELEDAIKKVSRLLHLDRHN